MNKPVDNIVQSHVQNDKVGVLNNAHPSDEPDPMRNFIDFLAVPRSWTTDVKDVAAAFKSAGTFLEFAALDKMPVAAMAPSREFYSALVGHRDVREFKDHLVAMALGRLARIRPLSVGVQFEEWGFDVTKAGRVAMEEAQKGVFDWFDIEQGTILTYQADVKELEATRGGRIILLREADKARSIISDIYKNNSDIYRLEPREFEEMISELLREKGFTAELTKQTRDRGYDILAMSKAGPFPVTFIAECKRYAPDRPVGVSIMREFSFVVEREKANKGIMFTSSYFTRDVRMEAAKAMGSRLEFMEYEDIMQWVHQYISAT